MAEKAIKKDLIIKGVNKTMLLFKWSIYQTRERTKQINIHHFFCPIFMRLDLCTIYDEKLEINKNSLRFKQNVFSPLLLLVLYKLLKIAEKKVY